MNDKRRYPRSYPPASSPLIPAGAFQLAAAFLIGGLIMDAQLHTNKHNVGALRHQVKKIKSSLFANKMGEIETSKEQEAKLAKILSLMEDHIGTDMVSDRKCRKLVTSK